MISAFCFDSTSRCTILMFLSLMKRLFGDSIQKQPTLRLGKHGEFWLRSSVLIDLLSTLLMVMAKLSFTGNCSQGKSVGMTGEVT